LDLKLQKCSWLIKVFWVCSYPDIEYLKADLDKYMSQFPKVRILRLKERHGLIRARLAGAQNATGKKLPHTQNWVYHNFALIYNTFQTNTEYERI
jgi:hypothetical protein